MAAAVCVGLTSAGSAQAAPTAQEVENQIDKQWEQLEPTIEQYNKVHNQLLANQKKAKELEDKIQPLSLQTDLAMTRVGGIAAKYYKIGPSSEVNAMLATGDPGTLTEQLTILDRLARDEQRQIADVVAARDKFNAEKQRLDALIVQLARQDADLAAKKKQIDAEIKRLEKLRETAVGKVTIDVGACPAVTVIGKAAIAVRTACQQLGKMYKWGSTGPNTFDCSGLTQFAWKKAGVSLTHFTGDQWNEGRPISKSEARAGDLVFFFADRHHVGIYLGNNLMVHASRAGQPVKVANIQYMPVAGFRRVA
ncbi:NlpC/P60 family protein [Micromonospora sp. NPDC049559]|uniref:C40 family peptidase n=1 Tax=Micromonospora sp. NPDC049559 TaxID=3155923 RepID=UPI0034360908